MTDTIQYQLTPNSIAEHLFDVTLHIASPDPQGQQLRLPCWIPGSYMIRDFARHIITLSVLDESAQPLAWWKVDKQTWQISPHQGPLTVQYQVYAFDLSVRSAYLCDEFGFVNGTSVFLEVSGQQHNPCLLTLERGSLAATKNWRVATTLLADKSSKPSYDFGVYHARDYDDLIDHPILIGDFDMFVFHTGEIDFEMVLAGGHQADVERIKADLTDICQHHIDFFGSKPDIDRYLFITMLSDKGYGGLEHRSSTALLFPRLELPGIHQKDQMTDGYTSFLGLCSHEFFHTWHVKRIRPKVLKEADLSEEVYTPQLWIYEGFTSYYDDLSLCRSGTITQDKYLELLGQNLTRLLRNQGRFKQSIAESSFEAWTKFYKQDASAVNNIVSYYNKGAIVAMCLDLLIRKQSECKHSLDEVMRTLWEKHGVTNLPTEDDVINTLCNVLPGVNVDSFIQTAVYGTDDPAIADLLETVGVIYNLRARSGAADKGGKAVDKVESRAFGAAIEKKDTGVILTHVVQNSPLCQAGAIMGDHLLAIDNWQISADNLFDILSRLTEGDDVALLVLRQGRVKELSMQVIPAELDTVYLTVENTEKTQSWLSGQGN